MRHSKLCVSGRKERLCDYLERKDCISQSGGAVLRVIGDRSIPLMDALLTLHTEKPEILEGIFDVIPSSSEPMRFVKVHHFRPPYLEALSDISLFLRDNGYDAASRFLDGSFEP